jgi:hypothetical protein
MRGLRVFQRVLPAKRAFPEKKCLDIKDNEGDRRVS